MVLIISLLSGCPDGCLNCILDTSGSPKCLLSGCAEKYTIKSDGTCIGICDQSDNFQDKYLLVFILIRNLMAIEPHHLLSQIQNFQTYGPNQFSQFDRNLFYIYYYNDIPQTLTYLVPTFNRYYHQKSPTLYPLL